MFSKWASFNRSFAHLLRLLLIRNKFQSWIFFSSFLAHFLVLEMIWDKIQWILNLMNTALSHIFLLSNIDQEIISMTIDFLKDIPHSIFCLIQIRNKFQPLISYIFWVLLYDTLSESQSLLTSIVNILVTYFCLWKSLDATFIRPLYYRFWGSSYEMDS